jgi:hypothetical protein
MTTNDLFIYALIVIVVMSVFVGALVPGVGTWDAIGIGVDLPAGIDFIWDTIAAFGGMLTFTIEGMPIFINLFCWILTIIVIWCLVRMPFGG